MNKNKLEVDININLTKIQARRIDKLLLNMGIHELDETSILNKDNKDLYELRCKINEELGN